MKITSSNDRFTTVHGINFKLAEALDTIGMILGPDDRLSLEYRAMEALQDKVCDALDYGRKLAERIVAKQA